MHFLHRYYRLGVDQCFNETSSEINARFKCHGERCSKSTSRVRVGTCQSCDVIFHVVDMPGDVYDVCFWCCLSSGVLCIDVYSDVKKYGYLYWVGMDYVEVGSS